MKLIIGLGNPGEKYKNTRHNVGFMAIDALDEALARYYSRPRNWTVRKDKYEETLYIDHGKEKFLRLVKPLTFMNKSGEAIKELYDFYKIIPDDLFVVHDDLDIKLGEYKIQKGKGPKLHYGISSIEEKLETSDFWRVRVGVDNRDPENRIPGEQYVLQDFSQMEQEKIREVIDRAVNDLLIILKD